MEMDEDDAAYLNYQYGEMAYIEENMKYSMLYERYEMEMNDYSRKLDDFRKGVQLNHPVKPQMPVLDHSNSIEKFKKLSTTIRILNSVHLRFTVLPGVTMIWPK